MALHETIIAESKKENNLLFLRLTACVCAIDSDQGAEEVRLLERVDKSTLRGAS